MSSEDGATPDWARLEFLEDGTPFAARYGDVYCSRSGRGQAAEVFVGGNRVVQRCARATSFAILETGLGLGLNLVIFRTHSDGSANCKKQASKKHELYSLMLYA